MIKTIFLLLSICLPSSFHKTAYAACDNHCHENLSHNINPHFMTQSYFDINYAAHSYAPGATQTSSVVIDYFNNLYTYSPINSAGSCGYVSLIQYLSFYDSFYNDSIIPEEYERNQGIASTLSEARSISPGVLRQSYPNPNLGNVTVEDFYNFVIANKDTDYQMKLMYIVNEYDEHSSSNYSYSIGMWNYFKVFNSITALNNATFSYRQYQNYSSNAKPYDEGVIIWFENYVKNLLDNDKPVILHIKQCDPEAGTIDDESYHSVVAYYYDSNGIHANFGWGSNSTDKVISLFDYYICEAGVLDFINVEETHSVNFKVGTEHYCGCGDLIEHSYTDHYTLNTSANHKAYCRCGKYILGNHTIDPSSIRGAGNFRYGICVHCGTRLNIGSDFSELLSIREEN